MTALRERLLSEASHAIMARGDDYGPPYPLFERFARYLSAHFGMPVSATSAVRVMQLFKIARSDLRPDHWDSAVDLVGYTALHAEVQEIAREADDPLGDLGPGYGLDGPGVIDPHARVG